VKKILLFLIFFTTSLCADDKHQKQIDELFKQLKSAVDFEDSEEIESKIWDLWITHPTKDSLTNLLADGYSSMSQNKLEDAYNIFSEVIAIDPNWAEAWNKRATVLYLMGRYEMSQADIDKVLDIEKRHFGALTGQGLVQTALKNYEKAIKSYLEAHKVHPFMKSPLIMIEKLILKMQKQTI
tara:strand:- start:2365 stop:2910 length:546 start_codon:yes stop_codon:yes gene_type:complete